MENGKEVGIKIAKGVLFVLLQIVAVIVIIALIWLGYNTAVNTMNVNMMAKDAFAKRAEVILRPSDDGTKDMEMLRKLFTNQSLARDEFLHGGYYGSFDISNYYERADVKFHIVWPWDDKATIEVTEIVRDIHGKPKEEEMLVETEDEEGNVIVESTQIGDEEELPQPMEWQNGVYAVKLVKDMQTDVWKINGIELKELMDVEELMPVPSVEGVEESASPSPEASPEATASAEPSATPEGATLPDAVEG